MELTQIEIKCSKTYFKIFLPKEDGAFGSNIENEPQISNPKLKKYVYYIFSENIALPAIGRFLQVVDFWEKMY